MMYLVQSNQYSNSLSENEIKEVKIYLPPFIKLLKAEEERREKGMEIKGDGGCRRFLDYLQKYMESTINLAKYDADDKTIEMVDNEREYYAARVQLYLSKATRTLLYLNSMAKISGDRTPIIFGYVDRESFMACDRLALAFHKASADYVIDYNNRNAAVKHKYGTEYTEQIIAA